MAMDMLSRWGSVPIIVGDTQEMQTIKRVEDRDDGVYLVLAEREPIKLSNVTTENVLSNANFIVVALSPTDDIDWAFDCRIDDQLDFKRGKDSICGRRLTEPEIKSVAEDLVAGDYNLDYLTGTSEPENEEANENGEVENAGSGHALETARKGSAPS